MIPLRDTTQSKSVPIVNYSLICMNIFFFLVQIAQGSELARFDYLYGLVPARYFTWDAYDSFGIGHQSLSFFSYMFLHGGFFHLLGNMWFLYVFGDNVEDHLGPFRYLVFYLLCGIASGLFHMLFNTGSNIPVIGASGAIAGVMGAYIILYPHAKVLTLVPIIIIPFFFEIPAYIFLGLWFLIQFFNAATTPAFASGVAWWAHVGGFVFGAAFLKLSGKIPHTGITEMTRHVTERRKTPMLQVIRPMGPADDPNLYGTMVITPFEAVHGARKIVNIPWGFQKRLYKVTVPPDTRAGNILRLNGLGKIMRDGSRGDMLLSVQVAGE